MRFTIGVIAAGVLVLVVVICIGFWVEGDRCLRERNATVTGGSIQTVGGGLFTSGTTAHYLWYTGKRKRSGEDCKTRRRVTPGEYERHMYKTMETDAQASP